MKTLYQCEVCKSIYRREVEAIICETRNPLAECPVRVGDRVRFETRHDGRRSDTVVEVLIQRAGWMSYIGKDDAERVLAQRPDKPTHEYVVRVSQEWQLGKDCYSDRIWLSDVEVVKRRKLARRAKQSASAHLN